MAAPRNTYAAIVEQIAFDVEKNPTQDTDISGDVVGFKTEGDADVEVVTLAGSTVVMTVSGQSIEPVRITQIKSANSTYTTIYVYKAA